MTNKQRFLLGSIDTSTISATSKWLQRLSEEFGLTPEDLYRIELCLTELITNIVSYAETQFSHMPIEVHAAIEKQRIKLTLIDPAQEFDPLSAPPPPTAKTIEELQVGGQGINLVREFSDAARYLRIDGKNQLELLFELAAPTKSGQQNSLTARDLDRRRSETVAEFPLLLADGTRLNEDRRQMPDRRAKSFISWAKIFHNVPYAALESMIDQFPIKTIVTTTTILKPGDSNNEVLIVLEGRLKVYIDYPGTGEHIEIGPGECVGEMSVIDNSAASAYVIAEEDVSYLIVDAASFLNRVINIPNVARNLISALSERMRHNNEQIIRRARKEIELEQVHRELQLARSIQKSLLPKEPLLPGDTRLNCAGRMCAAREVGGDFYDIFALDSKRIFFVIADVCGKGLPAALFMVRALAALRAQSGQANKSINYTEQVVTHLNQQLCTYNDSKQFLTAFCGTLDLETMTLHYVNAGHNAPVLALGEKPFCYLNEPINPIVGIIDGIEYIAGEIKLTPGSILLMYTDGVTEAEDVNGNMLGDERLLDCLNSAPSRKASHLIDSVFTEIREYTTKTPQSDDITFLAIQLC